MRTKLLAAERVLTLAVAVSAAEWKVIGPGGGGAMAVCTISPHDPKTVAMVCGSRVIRRQAFPCSPTRAPGFWMDADRIRRGCRRMSCFGGRRADVAKE